MIWHCQQQTEDLSLKANSRRNEQVPSIKSSFLFKLWSLTKCTGTVETKAIRLSDFHANAPINQFCTFLTLDTQGQSRGHSVGNNSHWILFKDCSSNHSLQLFLCATDYSQSTERMQYRTSLKDKGNKTQDMILITNWCGSLTSQVPCMVVLLNIS